MAGAQMPSELPTKAQDAAGLAPLRRAPGITLARAIRVAITTPPAQLAAWIEALRGRQERAQARARRQLTRPRLRFRQTVANVPLQGLQHGLRTVVDVVPVALNAVGEKDVLVSAAVEGIDWDDHPFGGPPAARSD
jgi:hypothetical protein